MKQHVIFFKLVLFLGIVILFACNSGDTSKTTNKDTITTSQFGEQQDQQTFYLIPSPEDMFVFTEKGKLNYSAKVLNPTENAKKYGDTKSKELNFGIYSADLAYSAAFSKYQETVKYLNIVKELSDEIGVSSVFNESLVKRIDNIIENKDSLKRVTSDSYYDIVTYLEKNKRNRSLALIVTGGWLESLFIVTNLVDKYTPENQTIQLIADQKMIFNNLTQYLDHYKQDEAIKQTIEQLAPIKSAYDALQEVKVESKKKTTGSQPNQINVGGGLKIVITADQFKDLKAAIAKVRNSISVNS